MTIAGRSPLSTLLLFILFSAALLSYASVFADPEKSDAVDDEEDLSFLEDPDDPSAAGRDHLFGAGHAAEDGDDMDDDLDEFDPSAQGGYEEQPPPPSIDDKDVVVLTDRNFTDFLDDHRHVMVEFYAPWCGHCQALAPEYAAAATDLKMTGHNVVLAKVDATEENELAQKYEIQGFPTVIFFADGEDNHKLYPGQRTKDAIVTWIKKKTGPGVHNVTTVEEAEKILTAESKLVVGFLDSLTGADSNELVSASKVEDEVNFYQTAEVDVATVFHIDSTKRPALVMLKKEEEKISHFNGDFKRTSIADFVFANKLPLVTIFSRENAPLIFENPIKKQILLFAASNDSGSVLLIFREAAKLFKGKLIFVYVEMDNEDVGKPVSEYFGVTGSGPNVLAYTGNEDSRKFSLDGDVTLEKLKAFGHDFLEDKLKPYYKSEPIPDKNDGDVKIIVGNNFDEIVLDESKDVLLEIYAPWCGHCQALEPAYNRLAKHLRAIDSLVIAKMDGTVNEHPRAKADGFPTLLFFPAGNKSFEPVTVDTDRTVVAFYKFIKKHASIPFKLQKSASQGKLESAKTAVDSKVETGANADLKDEL